MKSVQEKHIIRIPLMIFDEHMNLFILSDQYQDKTASLFYKQFLSAFDMAFNFKYFFLVITNFKKIMDLRK